MKKKQLFRSLFAGIFLLGNCMAVNILAQDQLGVHGGIGSANVEVNGLGLLDIAEDYIIPVTQYHIGLRYEKALSSNFALVTGAQYASRGFATGEHILIPVMGLDIPIGARMETRLQYMEAPVMIQYNMTSGGIQPYVQAGISAAYALEGKIIPRIDALISWRLPDIDINLNNDLFNRWDLSALAGAGVHIPVNGTSAVNLQVSYRHSLNDMFLNKITDIQIKSHGYSVGVGYSIRF